ncbi:MAG: serine hydrolase [Acidobacteria bacterium]|nr:serine hydrolase [Acidobacteriota bacterium]
MMRYLLPLLLTATAIFAADDYFPPPDRQGGWRAPADAAEALRVDHVDQFALDKAFDYIQTTTKNGGLLVARRGRLVYERYFGRAHRDATPNHASVGKSFISIAVGILMAERPELFPDGLGQKVFTPVYFPPKLFPLRDPRMKDIKLGQLLAMSAGIRGNNPGIVHGKQVILDPPGPDGWQGMFDPIVIGAEDAENRGERVTTKTLWVEPGGGYSYATASAHLASIMLRHVSGMELEEYVRRKLAEPLGWGRWGWGYKSQITDHTPGGGGIAPRPTDMLRFAYLLLREGRWGDRQLVPAAFVRHARSPSPYNPHFDYSLQFDVNGNGQWRGIPRDAFWKTGSGGFCIYIVPSLDLVVFKMGGRDDQYSPENTQMAPTPGFTYDGSRDDWTPPETSDSDPYHKTLQLVITSFTDR